MLSDLRGPGKYFQSQLTCTWRCKTKQQRANVFPLHKSFSRAPSAAFSCSPRLVLRGVVVVAIPAPFFFSLQGPDLWCSSRVRHGELSLYLRKVEAWHSLAHSCGAGANQRAAIRRGDTDLLSTGEGAPFQPKRDRASNSKQIASNGSQQQPAASNSQQQPATASNSQQQPTNSSAVVRRQVSSLTYHVSGRNRK
jgi:hypothetical protein